MSIQAHTNLVAQFFQGVRDLAAKFMPKERAVRIWDICGYVQKELDEAGGYDTFGDSISTGYVIDGYIDNNGTFVLFTRDGKLFKVPVFVDEQSQITTGEEQEVFMEFSPVSRSLMIQRQTDGTVRWYAMPACTAFLNRSGEIDSRALFDTFVEYAERSNEFPELDFYHFGERLTLGKADMLFRDDVNFCASGTFYDTEIARAAIESIEKNGEYWGLSIAYLPTKEPMNIRSTEGIEIPVFNDGICRYISLLPEDTAASILTSISTEEVNRMKPEQEKALKKLVESNPELFDEIVEKLDANNRAAKTPGVIVRQQTAPAASAAVAKTKPAPTSAKTPVTKPVKREFTDEDIEAILSSDKFKAKFDSLFTEARAAETPEPDEEGVEEPETEEAPVSDPAAIAEERSVKDLLTELIDKVDGVTKTREAEVQQILDDLPAKVARARIVRPRGATQLPEVLNSKERRSLPLAEIANATLEKIGAAE